LRAQDTARLVALASIWGASFIFFRVLSPVLGPIVTASARVLLAGAALLLYCRVCGFDTQLRDHWRQYGVLGIVNSAIPFVPPPGTVTPTVVANMLALALLCSAVAYLLYYRLIADIGFSSALAVTFLIPAFGVLWGALFLGETITLPMLAGCALIVGGTATVLRPPSRRSGNPL
jgi:drug/metabolite transporter (DMT)-like permease